jgi:hypothetical protein
MFFYGIPLLIRNLVSVPMASTRCQLSLEIGQCFSFEKLRSSAIHSTCHSEGLYYSCACEQECTPCYFSSELETPLKFYRLFTL